MRAYACSPISQAITMKIAAPRATRALVRSPAAHWRHYLLRPIRAPGKRAIPILEINIVIITAIYEIYEDT